MSKEKAIGIYFKNRDFVRIERVFDVEFNEGINMVILHSFNTDPDISMYKDSYYSLNDIESIKALYD